MYPRSLLAALLLPAALAIQVTSPTQSTIWLSGSSSQTISWSSVVTDPTSFAIVLVNQDRSVLPTNDILLADNVSTTAGTTTVTYPSGSWPVGNAFQVNLIRSSEDTSTIYAQSNDFNITSSAASSTSSSSSSVASNTGSTLLVGNSNTLGSTTNTASGAGASTTGGSTLPNSGSGSASAAGSNTVQMGALVLGLGLVGALLA
ncbi:hypothetical protein CALCODRAFT_479231 [Calocera cornea HHB12733]|uniref:Yeast cell wall synthesis Kre9/Knh1-like N-terminal domain-containing protein n=1 Tax=Calocera cornea HHB12733 TaxID=1353952 RepID=A0A165JVS5_9BASI|nr:hypothetical protein CALCODRAFT_479231 [Calocera cornea HHB12733]